MNNKKVKSKTVTKKNINQTSNFQHLTSNKGITLVALIITIIILLILAVVAISAVTGDGILNHAKNARDEYGRAQENEAALLQEYMNYLNNEISGGEEDNAELDLFKKYVLGAEKTGRALMEIIDVNAMTFINEESTIADASTTVTYLNMGANANLTKMYIYAKYNNKAYKVVCDATTYVTESVAEIYTPQGREGTTVQYDSNGDGTKEEWVILTDRGGKVEIVSKASMGSLRLGFEDTSVNVTTDLDGDGTVGDEGDKAIASYNNAITRINGYCKEIVTSEEDSKVRSVGASTDTSGNYSSSNFNSWFKGTGSVKAGDEYYEQDLVKMSYFGIAGTGAEYRLASRCVWENSGRVYFRVNYVYSDGSYDYGNLWFVDSDGEVDNYYSSCGVRPVVINPSGI